MKERNAFLYFGYANVNFHDCSDKCDIFFLLCFSIRVL
jgi:hypothetical protein